MIKEEPNPVGLFASMRYGLLKEKFLKHNIQHIVPDCGFFMYANVEPFLKKKGIRDQYVWLDNIALDIPNPKYKGYAKINLIARESTFNAFLADLS